MIVRRVSAFSEPARRRLRIPIAARQPRPSPAVRLASLLPARRQTLKRKKKDETPSPRFAGPGRHRRWTPAAARRGGARCAVDGDVDAARRMILLLPPATHPTLWQTSREGGNDANSSPAVLLT